MKVAFILEIFPSLSETFILNQITGLVDLGVQVDIYAIRDPREEKVHPDIDKYNLRTRVTYIPAIPSNRLWRQCHALALLARFCLIHPVMIFRLVSNFIQKGRRTPLLRWLTWFRFVVRNSYNIVHCQYGPFGNIGASLKYIGLKAKLVTTFYGFDVSRYPSQHGARCYDLLFEYADLILVLSKTMKSEVMALGCPPDKIKVHHLGTSPDFFTVEGSNKKRNDLIQILTVGRLTEKKGISYSIEAFASVARQMPDMALRYVVAGEGPLRTELEGLVRQLGMEEKIVLVGAKNQSEIVELFKLSHIFMLASTVASDGDQEGTPTVIAEAMLSGLPVLSTRHAGIPEMVQDNKTGYLLAEKDVDAMVEKLLYLVRNSDIAEGMGKQGRIYAEEHFNIHTLNRQLFEIYKNVSGS